MSDFVHYLSQLSDWQLFWWYYIPGILLGWLAARHLLRRSTSEFSVGGYWLLAIACFIPIYNLGLAVCYFLVRFIRWLYQVLDIPWSTIPQRFFLLPHATRPQTHDPSDGSISPPEG